MTAHRWFANKACPGDYLYNRFGDIAAKVNALLVGSTVEQVIPAVSVVVTTYQPVLRKGSYGTYTKKLQDRLLELGYPLGKYGADSSFGNDTLNAVKLFQRANNLDVDGIVGSATWAALNSGKAVKYSASAATTTTTTSRPVLQYGLAGHSVVTLQNALIKAGYSVGPKGADGIFGSATLSAVRKFQKNVGIGIDGIVGGNTWKHLEKYING
jgi:N-acetylmuramoyl-L-alanine amidase